ncbi:hypothetical protein Trydic_g15611 [Trypoxylus dichotomus]
MPVIRKFPVVIAYICITIDVYPEVDAVICNVFRLSRCRSFQYLEPLSAILHQIIDIKSSLLVDTSVLGGYKNTGYSLLHASSYQQQKVSGAKQTLDSRSGIYEQLQYSSYIRSRSGK